ncbi:hypothetical protein RRG08_052818 [Elysia crispata]|uniref:Uncharacterized protein n=1 Tax=Elysia crispata TaxID=231223 RepID=A0AAE1B6G7_9GAST|nr:hypothetical protein RRG08_052818 [Elysia crispata]
MESPAWEYYVFTACPRDDVMRSTHPLFPLEFRERKGGLPVWCFRIRSTQIQTWGDNEAFCRSTPDVESGCAGGGVVSTRAVLTSA